MTTVGVNETRPYSSFRGARSANPESKTTNGVGISDSLNAASGMANYS